MRKTYKKKNDQLGMSFGKAGAKLKKDILFDLVKKCGLDVCFQCGDKIESSKDFSIEHKIPYLDSNNPVELFFDLDNIAFSHLKCNIKAARQTRKLKHPSQQAYKYGCRCEECKVENTKRVRKWRKNKEIKNII